MIEVLDRNKSFILTSSDGKQSRLRIGLRTSHFKHLYVQFAFHNRQKVAYADNELGIVAFFWLRKGHNSRYDHTFSVSQDLSLKKLSN